MSITPPSASPQDIAACAALTARLPATLDHDASRPVTPASPLTAAWGRPAITLLCGLPPVSHPVSANVVYLDGADGTSVGWYEDVFDPTLWVTRVAPRLAVHIPTENGFVSVLGPITAAVHAGGP